MRLNKKTIDKIVQKLKSLIRKVEKAEAGATELEKRTGLDKGELKRAGLQTEWQRICNTLILQGWSRVRWRDKNPRKFLPCGGMYSYAWRDSNPQPTAP